VMLGGTLGDTVAAASPPAPDLVSPGIAGFIVVFGLALATVLLLRSMVGHMRKVRYGPGPPSDAESGAESGAGSDAGPQPGPPASGAAGDEHPARDDVDDGT